MRRSQQQTRDLVSLDEFARSIGQAVADDEVIGVLLAQTRQVLDAEQAWLVDRGSRCVHLYDGETLWQDDRLSVPDQRLLEMTRGGRVVNGSQADLLRGMEHLLAAQPDDVGRRRVPAGGRSTRRPGVPSRRRAGASADSCCTPAWRSRTTSSCTDCAPSPRPTTTSPTTTRSPASPAGPRFNQDLSGALLEGQCAAVLLLDLDRFKEVNDTLGHHNGDVVLEEVGRRITDRLDPTDLVSRLGGDEFAVLLTGERSEDEVYELARGIEVDLKRPFLVADLLVDVGASIGIALPGPRRVRPRRPPPPRRRRHVRRQERARGREVLHGRSRPLLAPAPGPRAAVPIRDRAERAAPLLPAADRSRDGRGHGRRDVVALAPTRRGLRAARGVHPDGGAHRPDRPADPAGDHRVDRAVRASGTRRAGPSGSR